MNLLRFFITIVTMAGSFALAFGESLLPAEEIPLDNLAAFDSPGSNWTLASGIANDPLVESGLTAISGTGIIVNTAEKTTGSHLFTEWNHGDVELELEFMVPKGSNSGVYLQSRYEIQLLDSWGVAEPTHGDCGGIYERWIVAEKRGYEGTAPKVNASRAPGLWQQLHIVFQAPRFNQAGKKIENARFEKVVLNGFVIHENIEVTGPTRAAAHEDEVPMAPIMIQGDHGPVALRNISIKHFDSEQVTLSNLKCEVRKGEALQIGEYDSLPPTLTPVVTAIDVAGLGVPKFFSATYTGSIRVPASGMYAFQVEAAAPTQLLIDDTVAILPLSPGGRSIPIQLKKGEHPFRLDYVHGQWGKPNLNLAVEGPGLAVQSLSAIDPKKGKRSKKELIIEPVGDRVRLQRGFVPYDPLKRLYAISVGSPAGTHFAYDFDTASILHAWSGPFLDTFEMWDGRGKNQLAKPAGPALSFFAKPTVAFVESTEHDWPGQPDALWSSDGYVLDDKGQPEFLAKLAELSIRDRIVPTASERGLERTIQIEGNHSSWWTGVLLAEAQHITLLDDGNRYVVGDREYYIDVSSENELTPFVRRKNGQDQLMLWIPKSVSSTSITYTLIW